MRALVEIALTESELEVLFTLCLPVAIANLPSRFRNRFLPGKALEEGDIENILSSMIPSLAEAMFQKGTPFPLTFED